MTLTPAREVRTASIIGARGHRMRPRKLVILGVALGVITVLGACGDRASSTGEEVGAGQSSTQSPTPSVVPPAPSTTQPVAPVETTPPSTPSPVKTSIPPLPPKPTGPSVQFTMPSGNIGCTMQSDGGVVRCDIRQRDWAPPAKPADCEYEFGQVLILGRTAGFVCASDTALIGAPVLPYGSTIRQGEYECRSDEVGVTCTNLESGHGFLLSAAEYRLFTQPVAPMETTPPSTPSPVETSIPPLPPKSIGPSVHFMMPSGNIGCTMQVGRWCAVQHSSARLGASRQASGLQPRLRAITTPGLVGCLRVCGRHRSRRRPSAAVRIDHSTGPDRVSKR